MNIPIPQELLKNADEIQKTMLENSPKDISSIEGDFLYDAIRPSAEESARIRNVSLQNALKMTIPRSATGEFLEFIGEFKGLYKNKPTCSGGNLYIKGDPGTFIEAGTGFCTPTTDKKNSIEFEADKNYVLPEEGFMNINVKCRTEGTIGNVQANTITILLNSNTGIKTVTNLESFTGGTDIEDEEHFRERVVKAELDENLSGADSDYVKWAFEVDGVGYAYPEEEWNGPGTVRVLILDKNGQIATAELIKKVKDYIYPDKKPGQNRGGKAPIGAIVTISTPKTIKINVSAKFKVQEGFNIDLILPNIKQEVEAFIKTIKLNGNINYNAIYSIVGTFIVKNEGIEDFENLLVNGDTKNIQLINQVAAMGDITNVI